MFTKIKKWFSDLPENKRWVDLITAALTVPVLITVITLNLMRLNEESDKQNDPTPTKEVVIVTKEPESQNSPTPVVITVTPSEDGTVDNPSATPVCRFEVAPFEISYPKENSEVSGDPLCVVMDPQEDGYCQSEWAYRIGESSWSSYSSNPICLFNMASGPVKLEIRVRNSVSGKEEVYIRNFIYLGEETAQPEVTLTPTNVSLNNQ